MNATFERHHRELGRTTAWSLYATLGFLGLTLLSALAGLPQAVVSFRGASAVLAYVFVGLLALFLVASVVAALVRYAERPAPQAAGRQI